MIPKRLLPWPRAAGAECAQGRKASHTNMSVGPGLALLPCSALLPLMWERQLEDLLSAL